jgi:hypothetical protein
LAQNHKLSAHERCVRCTHPLCEVEKTQQDVRLELSQQRFADFVLVRAIDAQRRLTHALARFAEGFEHEASELSAQSICVQMRVRDISYIVHWLVIAIAPPFAAVAGTSFGLV